MGLWFSMRCIFLSSYIKPQPCSLWWTNRRVVSSYHPTSNRNLIVFRFHSDKLYLLIILHQTATANPEDSRVRRLYLLIILHQTATFRVGLDVWRCCIFLSSYIKPQPKAWCWCWCCVVSSYHPTSNRNLFHSNYSANARPIPLSDGYLNYEPCLNAYQSAK